MTFKRKAESRRSNADFRALPSAGTNFRCGEMRDVHTGIHYRAINLPFSTSGCVRGDPSCIGKSVARLSRHRSVSPRGGELGGGLAVADPSLAPGDRRPCRQGRGVGQKAKAARDRSSGGNGALATPGKAHLVVPCHGHIAHPRQWPGSPIAFRSRTWIPLMERYLCNN